MRSIRTKWICGIVVVVAAVVLAGQVRSQPGAPAPEKNEFQNKILVISMRSVNTLVVLEQARVRPLGGQPFLVGRYLDDPIVEGGLRGRTTWLALIDVLRFVEFDDLEQLKKDWKR